jgi:peptidoglycan hydrolase-like protein with peptidoglycan-binding domain
LERDLARVDLWEESLRRSRQRRELAAARGPELPGKSLSVAALVALAGVPATGVAAAKVFGGGGGGASATAAASKRPVAVERPDPRLSAANVPAKPAAAKAPAAHTATHTVAAVQAAKPKDLGVTGLQQKLGVSVDGDFGARTEKALKRWQRAHGVAVDGVAGPQVRTALDLGDGNVMKRKLLAKRHHAASAHGHAAPVLKAVAATNRAGRHGGGVSGLQRALGLSPDGVFGPATQKALKRWQRAHGLTADGVAGPATRAKLGLGAGKVLKRRGGGHAHHRRSGGGGSSTGGGGSSSVVQRVIAAANAIATKPYIYGGGHGSFNAPGYDCSGSVSYALHGGGLLSSPLDSSALMSYGAPGPGRHITIYANPGHVYMTIDGRRFDTSARSQTGSRWGGGGRSGGGYVVRHPAGY